MTQHSRPESVAFTVTGPHREQAEESAHRIAGQFFVDTPYTLEYGMARTDIRYPWQFSVDVTARRARDIPGFEDGLVLFPLREGIFFTVEWSGEPLVVMVAAYDGELFARRLTDQEMENLMTEQAGTAEGGQ